MNRILIVDDEPDVLEFLSYNFRKNNFDVLVANGGVEGMMAAISERPDIILSDIMMPEMNGIEMCEEIRKKESMNDTPIIFLTAVTDDYKVQYAMSAGANQIVNKLVRFEYLLEMVAQSLNHKIFQKK